MNDVETYVDNEATMETTVLKKDAMNTTSNDANNTKRMIIMSTAGGSSRCRSHSSAASQAMK